MSQASRSKVRARARHREQVARLIGQAGAWCITPPGPVSAAGSMRLAKRETFFDVAAARELGERMVSDGEALALERVPFVGWCMSRGLGPDNRERGAFVSVDDDCQWISHEEWDRRGNPQPAIGFAGEVGIPLRGGFPGKLAREWQRMGGRRNVAHGAELRRMGQRLLDAIAGQPNECQIPGCPESGALIGARGWSSCPDCHGTGHNLAGVLPGLEWSAQVRRKTGDALWANWGTGKPCAGWISGMPYSTWDTRTVPRGEHRKCPRSERTAIGVELRDQQRGWMRTGYAADGVSPVEDRSRWPRWRRGELRHAEQRRAANS